MKLVKYILYDFASRFRDRPGNMLSQYLALALWTVPYFLLNLGIAFAVDVPSPQVFLVVGAMAEAVIWNTVGWGVTLYNRDKDLLFQISLGLPPYKIFSWLLLGTFFDLLLDLVVLAGLAALLGLSLSPWFYPALFLLFFPVYTAYSFFMLPLTLLPEDHGVAQLFRPLLRLSMGLIYPVSVLRGPVRDLVDLLGLAEAVNLLRASATGPFSPSYLLLTLPYVPLSFLVFWASLEILRRAGM